MTSRTFLPRIKIAFLTFYNATGVSDSTLMHCLALQSFLELQRLPSMLSNSVHHKLLGWEIGTVNQLNTSDFISANTNWKCHLPETGSGLNRRRALMARDKESLHLMARRQRTRPQQLSKMKPRKKKMLMLKKKVLVLPPPPPPPLTTKVTFLAVVVVGICGKSISTFP